MATRTGLRRSNDERARRSVNVPAFARRTPSGGSLVESGAVTSGRLPESEKLRRVFASGKGFESGPPSPRAAKSRTGAQKPGEPHDRLQGATDLQAVEVSVFGQRLCGENRRSREERQGRNERRTWQSFAEAWATAQAGVDAGDGHVGEGASMNPMRGVHLLGHGLRAVPSGLDRANRYVSEEEAYGVSTERDARGRWQRPTNHRT